MKRSLLNLIIAFALVAAGMFAIPALAEDNDDSADTSTDDGTTDASSGNTTSDKSDAWAAAQDRRAAIRDAVIDHRECVKDAKDDHAAGEDPNVTREKVKACHADMRADFRDIHTDFKQDKRDKHRDHVADRRAAFRDHVRDVRSDRDFDREKCAENTTCSERMLAFWQQKQEHAEARYAKLEEKLALAEAELEEAQNGNATDHQLWRLEDKVLAIKIHLLQIERALLRIEAKIAFWENAAAGQ